MISIRQTFFATGLSACLAFGAAACATTPSGTTQTAVDANGNTTVVRSGGPAVAVGSDNEAARRALGEDAFDEKPTGSRASERAKADAQEAHDVYRGQATMRLDHANARIVAAQQKLTKAGARASADVRSRVDAAAAQRTLVSQQISQLPAARDDQWSGTTKTIDANIESLDALTTAATQATEKL